jgi:hypothetical protein
VAKLSSCSTDVKQAWAQILAAITYTKRGALVHEIELMSSHLGVEVFVPTTKQGSHWAYKRAHDKSLLVEVRDGDSYKASYDEVEKLFNIKHQKLHTCLSMGRGRFQFVDDGSIITISRI